MALMMVRMLIMARLLNVHAFAEFSGGILISSTFSMLGCLGLQSMLQRQWPVNMVRRQECRGLVLAAQCNLVALICSVVGILVVCTVGSLAGMSSMLLTVGIVHGFSQQLFLIATVESRSRGEALSFAQQNLIRSIAALSLSAGVAMVTGSALATLLTDTVVSIGLSYAFFHRSLRHVHLGARAVYILAIRRLHKVRWRSALTLMAVLAVSFWLLNIDRWVASKRLGTIGFAHYSFASIVLTIAQASQSVVNASVYPLLARRFAEFGVKVTFDLCLRLSISLLVISAALSVPVSYLLHYGIYRWFPQYVDAVVLLPLFLVIAVLRLTDFWSSFLLIVGFESRLLKLNLFAGAVGALAWTLLTRPWSERITTLSEVGLLAVFLTITAYIASGVVSWRARNS